MTPQQINLVQSTWMQVLPIQAQAAELFYGRLFSLEPSLQTLFKGDMAEQGRKLMKTIGLVVNSLTRLEEILPTAQDLGRRHVGYGVRPEHYATVGASLLWTLEQGLGAAFTPEVKDAWAGAYGLLAQVMQDAAAA